MSVKPIVASGFLSSAGNALGDAEAFNQKVKFGLGNSALAARSAVEQAKERAAAYVASAEQDKWSSIMSGGLGALGSVAGGLSKSWANNATRPDTGFDGFGGTPEVRSIAEAGYRDVVVDPGALRGVRLSTTNPYGW